MKTNALLLLLALLSTPLLVVSGIDWWWAKWCETYPILTTFFLPSVPIGIALPMVVFPICYVLRHQTKHWHTFGLQSFAAFLWALALSTALKGISNRVYRFPFQDLSVADFSHQFRFGWLQGDSLWTSLTEGYPSGHTLTATAMCLAARPHLQLPYQRFLAIAYPVYIGLGMSFTEHWLSDVVTGALLAVLVVRLLEPKQQDHSTANNTNA